MSDEALPPASANLDLKALARGTTLSDRLGAPIDAVDPSRLTQAPPQKLKQNRMIDRLQRFLSPPTPPQSPVAKAADAKKVLDDLRDKTSGGKKTLPGEHTLNLPGLKF